MKKIYIENIDDYILVDDEDFERVNFYKWHKSYAHDTQRFLAQILGKKRHYQYSYLTINMLIKRLRITILQEAI